MSQTPVINIISSKIQNQHGLHQAASNREPTPHSNDEPNAASVALAGLGGFAVAILIADGGWGLAGTDGSGGPAGVVGFSLAASAGAAANCL